jgi:hypothetical protein
MILPPGVTSYPDRNSPGLGILAQGAGSAGRGHFIENTAKPLAPSFKIPYEKFEKSQLVIIQVLHPKRPNPTLGLSLLYQVAVKKVILAL